MEGGREKERRERKGEKKEGRERVEAKRSFSNRKGWWYSGLSPRRFWVRHAPSSLNEPKPTFAKPGAFLLDCSTAEK